MPTCFSDDVSPSRADSEISVVIPSCTPHVNTYQHGWIGLGRMPSSTSKFSALQWAYEHISTRCTTAVESIHTLAQGVHHMQDATWAAFTTFRTAEEPTQSDMPTLAASLMLGPKLDGNAHVENCRPAPLFTNHPSLSSPKPMVNA